MRKGLLAKIHIGKADLGLNEEEWRKMILEISNNRTNSSKDLKMFELEELLRKLKGLGFMPTVAKATPQRLEEEKQRHKAQAELKILLELLKLPKNYAIAMAKNMFAISDLNYLKTWQLKKIIRTLGNRKLKAVNG